MEGAEAEEAEAIDGAALKYLAGTEGSPDVLGFPSLGFLGIPVPDGNGAGPGEHWGSRVVES